MVKLTAEMIQDCAQYTNALNDREIDLRGYKISVIENLGATLDQFECMDMSDNDIRKLEGFPLLKRLKTLLLNNNRICRIQENLEECVPHLESVILTNNNIQDFNEIDPLATIKTLRYLSFLRNPVASRPNYRLYVISKIPQVRVLDFQRIRQKERLAAARMFKTEKAATTKKTVADKKPKTFEPKAPTPTKVQKEVDTKREMDVKAIKAAIANATSLDEVQRLEQMLQKGQIPGRKDESNGAVPPGKTHHDEEIEEMDES